jgi:hypothetical protein
VQQQQNKQKQTSKEQEINASLATARAELM